MSLVGYGAGTPHGQQKNCFSALHVSQMRKSVVGTRVLHGCFETQVGSSGLMGGVSGADDPEEGRTPPPGHLPLARNYPLTLTRVLPSQVAKQ